MSKVIDNIEDIDSIDAKANLASPTFTGTPTLPTGTIAVTQAAGDDSTKVATTAFVNTEISNDVGVANSGLVKTALNATGNAPIYACRAWVNFNGTGTVAIRASGNVSSITDNGLGDYTVNFTTAMSDTSFSCLGMGSMGGNSGGNLKELDSTSRLTTSVRLLNVGSAFTDPVFCNVSIFR